jgi:hypothetical protein
VCSNCSCRGCSSVRCSWRRACSGSGRRCRHACRQFLSTNIYGNGDTAGRRRCRRRCSGWSTHGRSGIQKKLTSSVHKENGAENKRRTRLQRVRSILALVWCFDERAGPLCLFNCTVHTVASLFTSTRQRAMTVCNSSIPLRARCTLAGQHTKVGQTVANTACPVVCSHSDTTEREVAGSMTFCQCLHRIVVMSPAAHPHRRLVMAPSSACPCDVRVLWMLSVVWQMCPCI